MSDIYASLISAAHSGAFGKNEIPHPSAEQCRVGNYKKGRVVLHGMPIAIETPQGQRRMGKSDGELWSVICMAHYGDLTGTRGADNDPLDVFIGPVPESTKVWVVNQNGKDGSFDEHKILLGFPDRLSARLAYMNSYERGWNGLGSLVACTIDQLKWWIKFGDTTKPLTESALPHSGDDEMSETVWDSVTADPVGCDLADVMYRMRKGDGEGLLLDAATIDDILEASDGVMALDALVVEYARVDRKAEQLRKIMAAVGGSVQPVAVQVTPPFKQRGTTNVVILFELSDGQTISIWMHNPDSTPNRILPQDELVSWAWRLNKKDVSIVVAPEKGLDLNPREVARRIMKLAERNSERFTKANANRAARMASIDGMKSDVSSKEALLASLDTEFADLTEKVEAKRNFVPATLQVDDQGDTGRRINETAATADEKPAVSSQELPPTESQSQVAAPAVVDDGLSDDPSSPNYRYADTGYIADSRKELAASQIRIAKQNGEQVAVTSIDWKAIEQNPRQAKELIIKSNLFGVVDWAALQERGMDAAAGFLIDRVYASIAPSPEDSPGARNDYARALQTIRSRLESLTTVKDVRDVLDAIREELSGANLSAEEAESYAAIRAKIVDVAQRIKDVEAGPKELYRLATVAESERYQAEKVVENRKRRGWAEDADATASFQEASARKEQAWNAWGSALKSSKENLAPLEAERAALYAESTAIKTAALERNASSPLTRGWVAFGKKFMGVVKYRYESGSSSFRGHVTNAESGRIPDWSWASKEKAKPVRGATKSEISFQLKVADSYERKGGKDVSMGSTKALKDAYGLRDVQSGNWVLKDPNSARFHVEQTAAAMSDLGDMLGIDAAHLGLGGRLAMAFGARGTGGKNAALAHYEPVHRVINLTKLGGGGSLGHELFHAFDNLLPSLVNGSAGAKTEFGTASPDLFPVGVIRDAFAVVRAAIFEGDIRSTELFTITQKQRDLAAHNISSTMRSNLPSRIYAAGNAADAVLAVDAIFAGRTDKRGLKNKKEWRQIAAAYYAPEGVDYINIPTGRAMSAYASAAVSLDEGSDGKYWSQDVELSARAFQSYLEDRMASNDRRNDYLSAMADNKHYDDETKPYPEGDERVRINAAFERLFEVLRAEKVFEKAAANSALLDSIFGNVA